MTRTSTRRPLAISFGEQATPLRVAIPIATIASIQNGM
jgi:hypothetical protein